MMKIWLEGHFPATEYCQHCVEEPRAAVIHCPDCAYGSMYCGECFHSSHERLPFHIPYKWEVRISHPGPVHKSFYTRLQFNPQ